MDILYDMKGFVNRPESVTLGEKFHLFSADKKIVWSFFVASSSAGREVCVHSVSIWWWRRCARLQPSPTIMFRSGLTQWALWRLIWRWWGRRACLSSWSAHRSFYFTFKLENLCRAYSMSHEDTRNSRDCQWSSIEWHATWWRSISELTDEEARVGCSQHRFRRSCFDSLVSLRNTVYHRDLICSWALFGPVNRLTVSDESPSFNIAAVCSVHIVSCQVLFCSWSWALIFCHRCLPLR